MTDSTLGRFHHVGVAVRNIDGAAAAFSRAFGAVVESPIYVDPNQRVRIQFMLIGDLRIELLEPQGDDSPVQGLLKRGLAVYHVCHQVGDLDRELERLATSGAMVISPAKPAVAFGGRRVAFVMCQGMMLELLEGGAARSAGCTMSYAAVAASPAHPTALDVAHAVALLDSLHQRPTIAAMSAALRNSSALAEAVARMRIRVGCLASFNFDPLRAALILQGLRSKIAIEPYIGPFGQFERELIDPQSELIRANPDFVLLAIRLQDVCPAIYERFNSLAVGEAQRLVDEWLDRLAGALNSFRRANPTAHLLIQNYDLPASPALGIADPAAPTPQSSIIAQANADLRTLAGSLHNMHVMDYDALVARHGRATWTDPRTALFGRIPIASSHYWNLAGFFVRHLRPLLGLSRKVLVLDADNTLWGGVVGDVGRDAIQLGHDFPGNAFTAFQQRVLDLYHRGVVLCIASKNEPGAVEDVLDNHPDMVLRKKHFAAMRVNWNPKPDNLRQLADELNLGLDSFVFVDDNPVECELVRTQLPQVLTITLPTDPAGHATTLEALDCFDQWKVSEEDQRRGEYYRADAERRNLQAAAVDLPTFYRSLDMRLTLHVNDPALISRVAQMTQRTNQFNMRTVRCSEDDIRKLVESPTHRVVAAGLRDRFGENGVIGAAIVVCGASDWVLEQFLMSCRILGRTVEECVLIWLGNLARRSGASRLVGLYVPTTKNRPFSKFYAGCGMERSGNDPAIERWAWELDRLESALPNWIEIREVFPA